MNATFDLPAWRALPSMAAAPWRLSGTVIGVLANDPAMLAAMGDAVNAPPYKAPPRAPILYVKPANTWIAHGAPIPLPAGVPALEMNATLGVVIGTTACRVPEAHALEFVRGYTIVNDVCEPHASFYRPGVRQRCRDGFCAFGPWVVAANAVGSPDALAMRVFVNGQLRGADNTGNLVRGIARLITDVTEFMTLAEGDVLLVGSPTRRRWLGRATSCGSRSTASARWRTR